MQYNDGLSNNDIDHIALKNIKTNVIYKKIELEKSVLTNGYSCPNRQILPIDISPDKSKAVFLHGGFYKPPKFPFSFSYSPSPPTCKKVLWLCLLDLKNYNVKKVIITKEFTETEIYMREMLIKWRPEQGSNLIAASLPGPMLIDLNKKKIIKKWNWKVREKDKNVYKNFFRYREERDKPIIKNIRWFHDGNKVGFLTLDGRLFIYDLKKDITTEVADDQDYFDFFWVK